MSPETESADARRRSSKCATCANGIRCGAASSLRSQGRRSRHLKAVDGVELRHPAGRGARAGRRERLRQVDHRHDGAQAACSRRAGRSSSTARTWPRSAAATAEALPPRGADRLSESVRVAQPALHASTRACWSRSPSTCRRSRQATTAMVHRALERAGLLPVKNFIGRYPHEMSGGQLQRVAIARAIARRAALPGGRRAGVDARRLGARRHPEPVQEIRQRARHGRSSTSRTTCRRCATSARASPSCISAASSRSGRRRRSSTIPSIPMRRP